MVAAKRSGEAEADRGARSGRTVTCRARLVEKLFELLLGLARVTFEPELELGVGESELTIVDLADVPPCLEVLD